MLLLSKRGGEPEIAAGPGTVGLAGPAPLDWLGKGHSQSGPTGSSIQICLSQDSCPGPKVGFVGQTLTCLSVTSR